MSTLKVNRIEPRTGDTVEIVGLDIPEPPEIPESPVKAWVNFNGSGTVAIRESGNVSSITDNGAGNYTMNFSTSMPDVNYAVAGSCNEPNGSQRVFHVTGYQTSDIRIYTLDQNSGKQDADYVNAVVVR